MRIKILNSVFCSTDRQGKELLKPCLSYSTETWRQGQYHRIRVPYQKTLISKEGNFLTGFLPKISAFANENNIPLIIEGSQKTISTDIRPYNLTRELRPDQINLISKAIRKQRGVLKAPTGIGKTVLALGFCHCFTRQRILFLCNEKSLLDQTYKEFQKERFNVGRVGDGHKEFGRPVTVATAQTFIRQDPSIYCQSYDIVIVDECDIGMDVGSTYYKILTQMLSPIRIGLSATLPEVESSKLVLEGLLGPVIGEMSVQEGVSKGLLAKPKIRIIKVPYSAEIRDLKRYPDVYEAAIVNRKERNEKIIDTAREYISQGKTVLILVTRIEHGNNLKKIAEKYKMDIPFVFGGTETSDRTELKLELNAKKVPCVIANAVWKRGINIPSLNVVINAAGEKSEMNTLQKIGRGLRKTESKDEIIIVDIFDPSHPFIVSHFGVRFSLYCEENWV